MPPPESSSKVSAGCCCRPAKCQADTSSPVARFQELQGSLVATQRQARDLQSENTLLSTRATEASESLEMATLDREVAEEKAEAAEHHMEELNQKLSEMELDVAILREQNCQLGRHPDRSS